MGNGELTEGDNFKITSRIRRGEDSVTQFSRQTVGVSCAWNATIASFAAKELPYRGLGTGVKRAIEVIPSIQFESDRDANWLKAIVKRESKSGNADSKENGTDPQKKRLVRRIGPKKGGRWEVIG